MKKTENMEKNEFIFHIDNSNYYLKANETFLKSVGLNSGEDIIGKSALDFPFKSYFESYKRNSQVIKNKGISSCFLEPMPVSDSNVLYLLMLKTPLFHLDSIIGVKGIGILINDQSFNSIINRFVSIAEQVNYQFKIQSMIQIIAQIQKYNHSVNQWTKDSKLFSYGNLSFTLREAQCLHYFFHNYSAEKTSEKLFISKKTVEFHLAKIKEKLYCNSSEIVNKAIDQGFIDIMFMSF
jgi:DNA-binding CsgD family transcriptional regulator